MMEYRDFEYLANAVINPKKVATRAMIAVPARSLVSPANLYVRVTGIANFDTDPNPDETWHRGTLTVLMPVLRPGDTMLEASANVYFSMMQRDESEASDDFAIALDEVSSVTVTNGGELVITVNAAYMGDVWVFRLGFAANLLVHRPSLDNIVSDQRRKFSLEDIIREVASQELHFPKR